MLAADYFAGKTGEAEVAVARPALAGGERHVFTDWSGLIKLGPVFGMLPTIAADFAGAEHGVAVGLEIFWERARARGTARILWNELFF